MPTKRKNRESFEINDNAILSNLNSRKQTYDSQFEMNLK